MELSNHLKANGLRCSSSAKKGKLRFCVDCRHLKLNTVAGTYPLPRMENCIDNLDDAAIISTIDFNSDYWQISVARKDRHRTTFTTFWDT